MKNKKQKTNKICPCSGSCDCHKPHKEKLFPLVFPFAVPFIFPICFPILITFLLPLPKPEHIFVNGKDCIIKIVTDYCNSTGSCKTHKEAVCP